MAENSEEVISQKLKEGDARPGAAGWDADSLREVRARAEDALAAERDWQAAVGDAAPLVTDLARDVIAPKR